MKCERQVRVWLTDRRRSAHDAVDAEGALGLPAGLWLGCARLRSGVSRSVALLVTVQRR